MEATARHSTGAALNAERRKGQNHKERDSGVEGGGCTVRARKGGVVIEKISVVVVVDVVAAWGDSGGIERHRTSCADRTSSHKRSFLVGAAGTYIGHPRTWVGRREAVVEVVASRKGG